MHTHIPVCGEGIAYICCDRASATWPNGYFQVAIVAAAVGPILVVPTVLAGPGLEDLLSAAAGIACMH